MNEPLHNRVGQQREIEMIKFLTRYGYATRANPYLKLHGAYSKYTNIKQGSYINSCNGWNRIVPVTLFLMTLFNASFMYHDNCEDNLLIMALNGFDIGESLSDNTFMNTLSKSFLLIQIIQNLNNYLIQYFSDALSFYVYDAGSVIATTIARRPSPPRSPDKGQSLLFHELMHSWVAMRF